MKREMMARMTQNGRGVKLIFDRGEELDRKSQNEDRHEGVVHPAEFTALPKVDSNPAEPGGDLIKSPGHRIDLECDRRKSPCMDDVGRSDDESEINSDRNGENFGYFESS